MDEMWTYEFNGKQYIKLNYDEKRDDYAYIEYDVIAEMRTTRNRTILLQPYKIVDDKMVPETFKNNGQLINNVIPHKHFSVPVRYSEYIEELARDIYPEYFI